MTELKRLSSLLHEYSPATVVSATKSEEAFANEVFDITTSGGERYFLKVLKKQHADAIAHEAEMQKLLRAAGIATPEYLEIAPGRYVGQYETERFLLSKYIPGSPPRVVTPKLIRSFGAMLARIHDALEGVSVPANDMQWLNPEKVKSDITSYEGEVRSDLDTLLEYGLPLFEQNLPRAVTHGDLWMSNVFAEDDEVTTVFDLETAEEAPRIIDLARTYTSLRFNSNYTADEVLNGLTDGYNAAAKQQLTPEELTRLSQAITFVCGACAIWHAVNGTRYRDPYIRIGKEAAEL